MSVESHIRTLIDEHGGRVPAVVVVREALGVSGAPVALALRLAEAAVSQLRGLRLEGADVVEHAASDGHRPVQALAVAPGGQPSALPPAVAWLEVPALEPVHDLPLAGPGWRDAVLGLARSLAGCEVWALSAASARRTLALGSTLARLEPSEEPRILALGAVARELGTPIRSAEDAAGLVKAPVPEDPATAARLVGELGLLLAERAGVEPARLAEFAGRALAAEFDFGERAFGRQDLLDLPETPGTYVFEDAAGELLYVGKAANLRRRLADYFRPQVEEREARIREEAHALDVHRTGSELTALLREVELIEQLAPRLNVQAKVHERPRASATDRLAVIQPSALGGAEVVLVDRQRGSSVLELVSESSETLETVARVETALRELIARPPKDGAGALQLALSWLADRGRSATVVDASGDSAAVAELVVRVAADPDLSDGRIVPVV